MTNLIGPFLKQEREKRGYSRQELARRLGYRNLNGGARWIERIETEGLAPDLPIGRHPRSAHRGHLARQMVGALSIEPSILEGLLHKEHSQKAQIRQQRDVELNDAVPIALMVVLPGGIPLRVPLPGGLTREDDLRSYYPPWSRKARTVYVEYGHPDSPRKSSSGLRIRAPSGAAFARIRGRGQAFVFDLDD